MGVRGRHTAGRAADTEGELDEREWREWLGDDLQDDRAEATWWWTALTRRAGIRADGRGPRWRIGLGAAVCGVLVLVLGVGWLGWRGSAAAPDGTPVPVRAVPSQGPAAPSPPTARTGAGPTAPATAGAVVVVHVAGEVQGPGVVRLPAGSRVADAVAQAGGLGPRAEPASVNLARQLVDGEQIVVAPQGAAPPDPAGGATAGGAAPAGPVDLNTATVEQLQSLPGVGAKKAEAIVQWREDHGRFSRPEELQEIRGIGEKTFAALRDLVRV